MTTNQLTGIRPGTYLLDPARSSCRITATHVFGLRPVTGTAAAAVSWTPRTIRRSASAAPACTRTRRAGG
ncbi:hypothetical protein FHR83_000206 [Actinoplanes campanulatus]|uniref:Uncharacterized protein n=1 Tax=Actinoplanes campanulatus TaxID=113559 RepID=A0A7W5AAM6_9ACTN|nr:hypothetical protein [Actinoplanes campanulatus]MBB3092572.1 hypothetical protein [Actinoplanes campanulatus]GGM97508.1 hypothetical protein GCM10010109_01320 [Actinoplanes campanulatus]GID34333.1 hypothetical protein Aca09nite_08390 [Actinoplanes campanulatus]